MTTKISARMAHWAIRFGSLGCVIGFIAFSPSAVQARCDQIYCQSGVNGCDPDSHYTIVMSFGTREGAEHDCQVDPCSAHAQCGLPIPVEELDVLEHAAKAGDISKVEAMLAEHSSLTSNTERSALQQLDCSGEVLAHIPVPSALLGDLAAFALR